MAREVPSRARLFVALALPDEARERIVAWQHDALGRHGAALRPARPEALHVTLAFLGHHPEDDIEAIAQAAFSRVGDGLEAPVLEATALTGVPSHRPRLWALDLDDSRGRAAALHASVAGPLAAGGWYEPEARPFWPHLTVARLRAGATARRVEASPPRGPFRASGVVLHRSRPGRGGAVYESLARMRLP